MIREQDRLLELKALAEVSGLINSSLDIQDVLRNAMTSIQRFMDAEASSIFEIDSGTGELFFRVALGSAADKARDVRLKPGEGIAGWVARTGLPLIIPDVRTDRRFTQSVDDQTGFRTRSILCVPLIYKERLNGVLEVLNKRGGKGFDEEDLELLKILANQVATALENARLYSRLNERFATTADQLKTTQEQLLQSEWLAALGRLSQGVAHEVRNPVMVIGGFARRMRKQVDDLSQEGKTLDIILEETERLEHMVTAIEEFSRMRPPVLEELSLGDLFAKVLNQFEPQFLAHRIEVPPPGLEDNAAVLADGELMEQVLRNVIQNAVDAQPNGGMLEVGLTPEAQWVTITVRDHGVGIPPETLPTVFEPFVTSKTRGSGLGLTAVHRIVREHGGDVRIDSEPGLGTEVRIRLPRGEEARIG
jgi:signal transduction histidine kinase